MPIDEDDPRSQSKQSSGPSLPAEEYLPAPQLTQSSAATLPCVSTYLPATQSWQTASSCAPLAGEYLPGLQATHSAGSSAPVVVPYLPAAQSTHPVDRSALAYLPATQSVHPSAAATEYLPADGMHACVHQHLNTPSLRHALHGAVRDWLNGLMHAQELPGWQSAHMPSLRKVPAAQTQSEPPSVLTKPALQVLHPQIHRQVGSASWQPNSPGWTAQGKHVMDPVLTRRCFLRRFRCWADTWHKPSFLRCL